ncbi:MAG: biliverdin-producing heme oxygenase [Acidobacteriota bacterium]
MDASLDSSASIMTRLKSATAEHHRRAEERALQRAMIKGTLTRDRFAAYLEQLLHVHRRLENTLEKLAAEYKPLGAVFRSHYARQADLQADLEFHGHEIGPPLVATQRLIADIDHWADENPVALLGPLYVLEGSMNGNKFIASALMQAWSLEPGAGFRYLDPYGDEQRAKWAEFRADMDAQGFTPEECETIIAAAQRTFDAIGEIADEVDAAPEAELSAGLHG